jgi:hypothetical protein
MNRLEAYAWLSDKMQKHFNDTHIAMFNDEECRLVAQVSIQKLKILGRLK